MRKDHAVIVIGRFQPPTAGHHKMVQHAIDLANALDADHIVYGSKSHGDEENPLPPDVKKRHMMKIFGTENIVVDPSLTGAIEQIKHAHDLGYKKLTLVSSEGRAKTYNVFRKYFGKRNVSSKTGNVLDLSGIRPENYSVVGIPRDPDSENKKTKISSSDFEPSGKLKLTRVSGSLARSAARSGDFDLFHALMPSHVTPEDSRKIMDELSHHISKVTTRRESSDTVIGNFLNEFVSPATRVKLARAARRTSQRRKMLRRARQKRRKSIPQLKKRAQRQVKDILRQRVYKGNWKKLSYSQRANIDNSINKKKKQVDLMVKRIMPQVITGETKRLQSLNSSYNPILDNFFLNYLSEAKSLPRKELDNEQKRTRRKQNKENKRSQRDRDNVSKRAGVFKNTIAVVRNRKTGDVEIVDKESVNKSTHEILVSPDKANKGNVAEFLKNKSFVNTVTSQRLFGYIKGAGKAKTSKPKNAEGKKEKSEKKTTSKSKNTNVAKPVEQKIQATKKASKKDTFATSHGSTEMESGIVYVMNSMMGVSPEDMVKKGLIDKKDLDAVLQNQHESFLPSCQRAAQQIMKQFGPVYLKHTGRLKKETKLSKEALANGVNDTTPKSDILITDKDGNVIAGLSQKIGESQLSSGGPAETITNLKWSCSQIGDKLSEDTKKKVDNFIRIFEKELSGNPRTKAGPVSLYQKGETREGEDKEVARREKLHAKATELINDILSSDKKLATMFVYSLMTGAAKFEENSPALATHIFSANRDGTDGKLTPIDLKYCEKILDRVKFQMKFKSSAVETTDVKKKWEQFKEHKKKLGKKVSLEEDFRAYSYRSVVRVYLNESVSFVKNLLNLLIENSEKKIKELTPDPQTPEEAVQYLKDAFDYIGNDPFKLIQFFEDTIDFDITQPILDWSELATNSGSNTNKIYINGVEFNVPVEDPYNYEGQSMISPLSESKRNYRKEYDNYHSKPEQRKNRSKRVLARRLMMKLGRVRKGDGKDVDHKDGNPKNNGKHNLRVRDKSENRADND